MDLVKSATLAQNVERAYSSRRSKWDENISMIYIFRQSVRSMLSKNVCVIDVVKFVFENVFPTQLKATRERLFNCEIRLYTIT